MEPRPKYVAAGQGPVISLVGDNYTIKVAGRDSGGAYALFEFSIPPGGGSPPHVHSREDEAFYVLEGTLTFYVNGERIDAGPGSTLHAPRNVPHHFRNESNGNVRALVTAIPAGIENFFIEVGYPVEGEAPAAPFTEADMAKLIATAERYGIKILI